MAEELDSTQLWQAVFKLYDRDSSGFADECDTVAAMISTGCPPAMARDMLARVCEDGRANLLSFRAMLRTCFGGDNFGTAGALNTRPAPQ